MARTGSENQTASVSETTLAALRQDKRNARRHNPRNVGMITRALREVGAARSGVVDEDGVILAGNATYEGLAEAGIERVKVVEADGNEWVVVKRRGLTEEQKHKLALYDNRAAELAGWDIEELARQAQEFDLSGLWTGEELDKLLGDLSSSEPAEDPGPQLDQAVGLQEKWQTAAGQLWEIPGRSVPGRAHRLLCGDSSRAADVSRLMGGQRAQLAVTSPPYGVGKSYEVKGIGPWFDTVRPAIANLCRNADVIVWNIGDLYATGSQFIEPTFSYSISMFAEHGYRPIWIRIWLKQGQNFGVGPYHLVSNKPVQQYEYVGAFSQGQDTDQVINTDDFEWIIGFASARFRFVRRLQEAERRAWGYAGIWRMNTVQANDDHPAMFPLELPERAIKMHSDKGAVVLDPFDGSGTTHVACERQGRLCYGLEVEPKYCAVILERLAGMGLEPHLCA